MDAKKFTIALIAGTVATFIMGYLIYGLALAGYFTDNIMSGVGKEKPEFLWLVLGHIFHAAALTYIFMKWTSISTLMTGLKAGLIIGILVGLGSDFISLGTSNVITGGIMTAIVDGIAGGLIWGAGGGAIGWALGMGND